MLSETFSIKIQGNSYTASITMGKMRDFELNKLVMSNGFYSSITDNFVLNIIDSVAALHAFYPEFKKDSKIESIEDLRPTQIKELLDTMEPFFGWYKDWRDSMSGVKKVEEKKGAEE